MVHSDFFLSIVVKKKATVLRFILAFNHYVACAWACMWGCKSHPQVPGRVIWFIGTGVTQCESPTVDAVSQIQVFCKSSMFLTSESSLQPQSYWSLCVSFVLCHGVEVLINFESFVAESVRLVSYINKAICKLRFFDLFFSYLHLFYFLLLPHCLR